MLSALFAFLHHIAAFALFACVLIQHLLFKPGLNLTDAKRISRIDMILGISAGLVLLAGIFRVIHFEKGSAYYLDNAAFYTKIITFAVVGLLSIYPTRVFFSWRRALRTNTMPEIADTQFKRITMILRVELLGLLVILFAAALMAKGLG